MKKTDVLMLILVSMLDFLFYRQSPGINVTITAFLFIAYFYWLKPHLFYNPKWRLIASITAVSGIYVGLYGDFISMFTFIVTFSWFTAISSRVRLNFITGASGMIMSFIKTPWHIIRMVHFRLTNSKNSHSGKLSSQLIVAAFTTVIFLVFFFLYRSSNLLFYHLTEKISFDFISFGFLMFTLFIWLILISIQRFRPVKWMDRLLEKVPKTVFLTETYRSGFTHKNSLELKSGISALLVLNLLLLIVNFSDLGYLIQQKLPSNISYTDYIHQGIGALITSIVLAITLILYFFRGSLNFTSNKWLKTMALLWIGQNMFMVISNVVRNHMYVHACGLTEKRIGVYVYLLLAMIGLFFTLVKILRKNSNAYLFSRTSHAFFVVLFLSTPIPWDRLITSIDLKRKDASGLLCYLNTLSDSNITQLLTFANRPKSNSDPEVNRQFSRIHERMLSFVYEYNRTKSWQSFNLNDYLVYQHIINRKTERISVYSPGMYELIALRYFPNLKELKIEEGYNSSFIPWQSLSNLKWLTIVHDRLTNIGFLIRLSSLEYLDLSGCEMLDVTPLYTLKYCKEIHLPCMDRETMDKLKERLPYVNLVFNKEAAPSKNENKVENINPSKK